ncbi:MAG: TonB-dependent siderophore receptor [Sphingomonadales bacterium]|nr:TonB-dependent siderophore receptor [Sphingomonadales bacterium]
MDYKFIAVLVAATSQVAMLPTVRADTADERDRPGSDIIVTAAKTKEADLNESASATGLDLTLRQTPQSVSVIDRQRIEDFALTNIADVLDQAVGVNVNRNETDRTDYTARGFAVTNRQVDGIGLSLQTGTQLGDLDTALFERVEIVRGANAIMTGVGNPSATINYLRKRPTEKFQANASAYGGSFDMWRVEGDVSGPLNAAGTIRARVIGAHEERSSYLDYSHTNRDVGAALLAVDVTPQLTATLGYSRQDNRANGVLWGALPLVYSDGTRIPYERSASTSAPWTYWNNIDQTAFGELALRLGGDWTLRGVFTYRALKSDAKILYASGGDPGPDPLTGKGVMGSSSLAPAFYKQYLVDGYASGSVKAFGRSHQLAFGVSNGWASDVEYGADADTTIDYGDIRQLSSFHPIEPSYATPALQASVHDRLTRVYGAAHIDFTDRLKGVVGISAIWLETSGDSYGADQARKNSAVSPYAGLLFDLTRHLTLYASYTDIYNTQTEVDVTNRGLDPAKGSNVEAGLKGSWLNDRLYASAAIFRARQSDLATFAGTFDGTNGAGPIGNSFYTANKVTARGVEAEVSGRITGRWLLAGGFTHLNLRDDSGTDARLFVPRDTLKLTATYQVPEWRDLKLGANLRYQSTVRGTDDTSGVPISQGSYATLDLLAGLRLTGNLRASVNVRNATNVKYVNSLEWGQGFYGAPRSAVATLRFEY